jgi:AraC family transcriptional regulator, positive regulator of tynA and feaB
MSVGGRMSTNTLWSTEHVAAPAQFEYWREVVCSAFVRLSPERPVHGGPSVTASAFRGSINSRPMGATSISQIDADDQVVHRRQRDIEESPGSICYLNVQLTGCSTVTQFGREAVLRPGDITLLDASAPFSMCFDTHFRQWSVHLDAVRLQSRLGNVEHYCGRRLDLTGAASRVLSEVIGSLWRGGRECVPDEQRQFGELIEGTVGSLLASVTHTVTPHQKLLAEALRLIDTDHRNSALSAPVLANQLGVSVRLLHQVFTHHIHTVGETITEHRLRTAAHMLTRPNNAHRSIADIAAESGFGDLSHFSRLFRARFSSAPGEYRNVNQP